MLNVVARKMVDGRVKNHMGTRYEDSFSKRKTIRGIDQRVHSSMSARACEGAFFDERGAANGVEGASLIFQLYTIASSGVSFLKHQRHFAHREATTVSARSSAPSRPLGITRF